MTVKVHAIKSTSRVIGAVRLGSLAEDLEAAGCANDTVILSARIGKLLTRCRELLGRQLAPLLHSDDLPLIPDDELAEAYSLIRDFLSVSDYDSALEIIDELGGYSYPENEKEHWEALKSAALEFDYETMKKIIAKI